MTWKQRIEVKIPSPKKTVEPDVIFQQQARKGIQIFYLKSELWDECQRIYLKCVKVCWRLRLNSERSGWQAALTWAVTERKQAGSASGCHVGKAGKKLESEIQPTQKETCSKSLIYSSGCTAQSWFQLLQKHPKSSSAASITEVFQWNPTCTKMRGLWDEGKGTLCIKWEMCLWRKGDVKPKITAVGGRVIFFSFEQQQNVEKSFEISPHQHYDEE